MENGGLKMNSKTEELLQRTFLFGVNTLKFLNSLPYTIATKVIMYQLAKSSTSVGANYEESQAAESKEDFIHKTCLPAGRLGLFLKKQENQNFG